MSKSFKGEERAQARAVQQRRTARRSKRNANENDSHSQSEDQAKTMPTYPVDARPDSPPRWTAGWRA